MWEWGPITPSHTLLVSHAHGGGGGPQGRPRQQSVVMARLAEVRRRNAGLRTENETGPPLSGLIARGLRVVCNRYNIYLFMFFVCQLSTNNR